MMKWATFFIFTFIICTIIASTIDGGGGISSTTTTVATAVTDTTLTVTTTRNFLAASAARPAYGMIGPKEVFSYTGTTANTFTGVTRGIADPQTSNQAAATAHATGTKVKTLAVGAMDAFMGYNITTSAATFGTLDAVTFGVQTLVNMPKFIMWDYSFLRGEWVMLRYVLFSLSGGFVFGIVMAMLTLAWSIWK